MMFFDKLPHQRPLKRFCISLIIIWFICVGCYFFVDKQVIYWTLNTFSVKQPFWEHKFGLITQYGEAQIFYYLDAVLLILGLAGSITISTHRVKQNSQQTAIFALYLFCSIMASSLITMGLKLFFGRYRPYYYLQYGKYGLHLLSVHGGYNSFPSGHSQIIWAAMTAVSLRFPQLRWVAYPIAALIAISRVLTHYHYPSDVIMGSYIGFITSILVYDLFSRWGYWKVPLKNVFPFGLHVIEYRNAPLDE